jgi:hypothetical protein
MSSMGGGSMLEEKLSTLYHNEWSKKKDCYQCDDTDYFHENNQEYNDDDLDCFHESNQEYNDDDVDCFHENNQEYNDNDLDCFHDNNQEYNEYCDDDDNEDQKKDNRDYNEYDYDDNEDQKKDNRDYTEYYEYDYDDNEDQKKDNVTCAICLLDAFIPTIFEYIGTIKDYRSDTREYFPVFDVMCYKCYKTKFNEELQERYPPESPYYRERKIVTFMKSSEIIKYCQS